MVRPLLFPCKRFPCPAYRCYIRLEKERGFPVVSVRCCEKLRESEVIADAFTRSCQNFVFCRLTDEIKIEIPECIPFDGDGFDRSLDAAAFEIAVLLRTNSGNAYAFAQKRALLKLAAEQAKSNNTQLKAQSIINTIDGDFMEENYQNNAAMASAEQDLRTPLSNDELHLINSKKYRIRELPR